MVIVKYECILKQEFSKILDWRGQKYKNLIIYHVDDTTY